MTLYWGERSDNFIIFSSNTYFPVSGGLRIQYWHNYVQLVITVRCGDQCMHAIIVGTVFY